MRSNSKLLRKILTNKAMVQENIAHLNIRKSKKHPKEVKKIKRRNNLKMINENSQVLIFINPVKEAQKIYKEINKKMMQILIRVK